MTGTRSPEAADELQRLSVDHVIDPVDYITAHLDWLDRFDKQYEAETGQAVPGFKAIGNDYALDPEAEDIFLDTGLVHQRVDINTYLDKTFEWDLVPILQSFSVPAVRDYFGASDSFRAIFEAHEEGDTDKQRASTAQFLIEHNRYCAEKSERLAPQLESYRAKFLERIPELVKSGLLPPSALTNLPIVAKLPIHLSDRIGNDPNNSLEGHYDLKAYTAYASIYHPEEDMEAVVTHELMHALGGVRMTKDGFKVTKLYRAGFRLFYPSTREIKGQGQDEAIAEIGSLLVLNPGMSYQEAVFAPDGAYPKERPELWEDALGSQKTFYKILDAYFTNDTPDNQNAFDAKLAEAVRQRKIEVIKGLMPSLAAGAALVGAGVFIARRFRSR